MKFELEPYHRNVPEKELLADVQRVAQLLSKSSLSRTEYDRQGKYSASGLQKRFGTWTECQKLAGLTPKKYAVSNEALLEDIQAVAKHLSKTTITSVEYRKYGKHDRTLALRRFGSWPKAMQAAGLETLGLLHRNASKEDLFLNLEEVWIKLGRQPHYQDMHVPLSKFSGKPYMIRFGSWRRALEEFVEFVNQDEIPITETIFEPTIANASSTESFPKHKTSRDINWRMRFIVMRRDNFKCIICGKSPAKNPEVELHVDHIKAWAEGGETVLENLQTLCSVCNIGKSDLPMSDSSAREHSSH